MSLYMISPHVDDDYDHYLTTHDNACWETCPGTVEVRIRIPRIVARPTDSEPVRCSCYCHSRSTRPEYAHALALHEDAYRTVMEVDTPAGYDMSPADRAERLPTFWAALHGDMAAYYAVHASDLAGLTVEPYLAYWYARFAASYALALMAKQEGDDARG
jgi:hypothetical protein